MGKLAELKYDKTESDANRSVQANEFLRTHAFFDVLEPYIAIEGRSTRVEVRTGMGGGDCGYPFKVGQTYVVYAYDKDGLLVTGICSRTREAEDAKQDLDFLRSLKEGGPPPYVYGMVGNGENRGHYDRAQGTFLFDGLPGANVTLTGEGQTRSTVTGADGLFRFSNIIPGAYYVRTTKHGYNTNPDYLQTSEGSKIQVHSNGCGYVPQVLVVDRRISGVVIAHDGSAANGLQVELVPARPTERYQLPFPVSEVNTDAHGHYELKNIRPGEYYLGINLARTPSKSMPYTRYLYPGTEDPQRAQLIVVGNGEMSETYRFSVPAPQRERAVQGFVSWPDGRPAENVDISLEDVRWPWQTSVILTSTDQQGHFTIQAFDKTTYRIHAITRARFTNDSVSAQPLPLDPKTDVSHELKLVLTEKGDSAAALVGVGLERWRAGLGL